jgi:hypothetical protein
VRDVWLVIAAGMILIAVAAATALLTQPDP